MLRLPLLEPVELNEAQKALHHRLSVLTVEKYHNSFLTKDAEERFFGPFGVVMHTPAVGQAFYDTSGEIGKLKGLSARAKEIAILAVGAQYGAEYELYAHTALGKRANLSMSQIQDLQEKRLPTDLQEDESIAFEMAYALAHGKGSADKELWQRASDLLGVSGVLALVHTIGFYAYLCILLNACDAKAPSLDHRLQ